MTDLPDKLNMLIFMDPARAPIDDLLAVAPERLSITAAPGQAFVDEAGMMPSTTGLWKNRPWSTGLSLEARETLLREAHILVVTLPYPKRLLPRMQNLLWAQYLWAGISDLRYSDLWGSHVRVGSSRGHVEALPIAEMVIANALYFAKNLPVAARQTQTGDLDPDAYSLKLLAGKTIGMIGLGGIGLEVARLAKAMGMRVVGSRRSTQTPTENVGDVDVIYPPEDLPTILAQSDFVALAPVLTDSTLKMINAESIAAMKEGAILINVGRGELIDEVALKAALRSGKLGGAYLDVYDDEWSRPPDPDLLACPNLIMTPHNSGRVEVSSSFALDILKANLKHFLAGEPLINEVDWDRGY